MCHHPPRCTPLRSTCPRPPPPPPPPPPHPPPTHQVFNVCTSPVVQQAWDAGRPLAVHGLVYQLDNGHLKALYSELFIRRPKCWGGKQDGAAACTWAMQHTSCIRAMQHTSAAQAGDWSIYRMWSTN